MNSFVARTFFRVHERLLKRPSFAILRRLRDSERWPRDRLEALQWDRLRQVLALAHEHAPYWREVMDSHGIRAADIRGLEDLRRFPLLEKGTIRARREEMVWREQGPRLTLVRTSGSTNEALQFYTNSNREAQINAARMRGHEWIGIRRGDREMYFWGSPVELSKQDRLKRLRDFFLNDGLTNGFELKPELVREYVHKWMRWRPKCIFGYPCSFTLLAGMAAGLGLDLRPLRQRGLKALCTTSELLTDADRRTVTEAFGVPVYDSYGLREGGLVGHECEHFTMHTMDEQVLLETVDPQSGQPVDGEGELVMTNLVSAVMPVIRYRTGDVVTLPKDPCPCGRTLGSVRVSGGRVADFVVTRDGRWIPGYAFIYICRSVKGIVKFQARQEPSGEVRVRVVVDGQFPPDGLEQVRQKVRARLRSDDEVGAEVVDDIAPAPSGKYRPVIGALAEQLLRASASSGKPLPPERKSS